MQHHTSRHPAREPGARFVVGIDLGTTNTVVAYAERAGEANDGIKLLAIEQLVAPGEIAQRPMLPSLRYHPAPGELAPADIRLPWDDADRADGGVAVVGSLARELGAQVPGRLVASAKSWLSHPSADRTAAILPWGAPEEVAKISPVDASASYLAHVRATWNRAFPDDPLDRQDITLTVPASFDDAARGLTLEAARRAGLADLRLVEEPQAAFYDWISRHRERLGEALRGSHLVLVCDVGGGTTDLTLIRIDWDQGEPRFTRIGVGDHLMLGGDNMDLGLAHLAEGRMAASGQRLSGARLSQLIQQCRNAKERLLAADAPRDMAVTVLGAGAKLIGGVASVALARDEVQELVVDGFFPLVAEDARPGRLRGGIVEFGLPYAADPAVTRHLAGFLALHGTASRAALGNQAPPAGRLPVPDTLLLNGGVFHAAALSQRLLQVLEQWRGAGVRLLHNDSPDAAVARGAVAYALARSGKAPRITAGSARSYVLLLGEGPQGQRGVCVLPRDTEVGHALALEDRTFALRVGEPVRFHLVSSTADTAYRAGDLVDIGGAAFVHLPPVATVIAADQNRRVGEIPVQLSTALTEVGTLEMHCVSVADRHQRWKLEFQLRGADKAEGASDTTLATLPEKFTAAASAVERLYGARSQNVDPKAIKRLRGDVEKLLGPREQWQPPLLRELYGVLWDGVQRRRRSADHERVWCSLAGFCLRPGFGYPLDDWRAQHLWSIFPQSIQYAAVAQNWSEWWTLWRRVAGGLTETAQSTILDDLEFDLQPPGKALRNRPPGPRRQGYEDMVRLAASLERVAVARKIEIGRWLLERLEKPAEGAQSWLAVGRIGARVPLHGSAHNVVPAPEAAAWLQRLLRLDWTKVEPAGLAAVMLARKSGDRDRDLDADICEEVIARLAAIKAPVAWAEMIRAPVELNEADQRRWYGDSLPTGLKLID